MIKLTDFIKTPDIYKTKINSEYEQWRRERKSMGFIVRR